MAMTRYFKALILCGSIKYFIMLILIVISVLLSKENLQQYASKATSFKQYEVKVTENESVALILNLWPIKKMDYLASHPYQLFEQWELGKDFTLSFGVVNYKTVIEKIELEENNDNLKIVHGSVGKVNFGKLITKWGNYYKIMANTIKIQYPYSAFLQIVFDDSIPEKDIPSIDVRMTSEINYLGSTMTYFVDSETDTRFTKMQGFRVIQVQPTKVIYLESDKKCQSHGFYKCLYSQMVEQNYDQCPRKCVPISTAGNALPLCETVKEFQCSMNVTKELMVSSKCLPACTQIDFGIKYDYTEDLEKPTAKRNVTLTYRMWKQKMKVYEEYLVEDFVNVLGAIGGTLGLFIGFSILGALNYTYKHIILYIERFVPKNLNILADSSDQTVIEVAPKVLPDETEPKAKSKMK